MAITPIRIPNFQQARAIVDKDGRPSPDFLRYLNKAFQDIQNSANAVIAAQNAADAANAAAATANAAAAGAQNAASSATEATALANSYVTGIGITATDAGGSATITITDHNRVYAYDPIVTVVVTGGSLPGLAYSTKYYIYYDQPSRAGGAVTYVATTNLSDVAQVNNRHSVAEVTTPAAAAPPNNGGGVRPPGGTYEQ